MNCMPRMVTYTKEVRMRFRLDPDTNLLFLYAVDPNGLLTIKLDGISLADDLTASITGLYEAHGEHVDAVKLLKIENEELVWAITSRAFERALQVA